MVGGCVSAHVNDALPQAEIIQKQEGVALSPATKYVAQKLEGPFPGIPSQLCDVGEVGG